MKFSKGTLIVMKGEKCFNNLQKLIDEIVKHGAHDGVKGGFLVKIPQEI